MAETMKMAQEVEAPKAPHKTKGKAAPKKIVICLNETRNRSVSFDRFLGYNDAIELRARKIEKDDMGIYQIVGNPTYELKPGDLEVKFNGYSSKEKNPIKVALLLGEVFLTEGEVDLQPIFDVSTEYDVHTKRLKILMERDDTHDTMIEVQEITEGFRLEAQSDLERSLKQILSKYKPRVDNVTNRSKDDLLTLLNCLLILEMDGENRSEFTSAFKELIGVVDPKKRFMYEMRA